MWCLAMEIWAARRAGVDVADVDCLKPYVGRGKAPKYKFALSVDPRQGPINACVLPAGYNAQSRVAATFAMLARRLQKQPRSEVWADSLSSLLASTSNLVGYFWQAIDCSAIFLILASKAIQAARRQLPAWHLSSFASFAEGIETKLVRESVATGKKSWQDWAASALKGGAGAAHRFCKAEQTPVPHVPRAQATGSFCQAEVAAEATVE